MKKIDKKLLSVGLIVLFFSISLALFVKAQVDPRSYFRVNSASTTPFDAKRAGDEKFIHIVNRTGKDYFVPNKLPGEFNSFRDNAPRYVGVAPVRTLHVVCRAVRGNSSDKALRKYFI